MFSHDSLPCIGCLEGAPSLPKEREATQGEHPLTPFKVQMYSDQPLAQRGPDEAPERPPAGVGILLFLNNIVARMGLYPFFLIEEERVSRDTAKTLKSL